MKDKTASVVEKIVSNTNFSNPENTNLLLGDSMFTVQLAVSNSKKKLVGRRLQNSGPDMNDIALKNGLSQVDLSSCEELIRKAYNISDDKFLLLKKSDMDSQLNLDNTNNQMSSNLLTISFYDSETNEKYDTNVCKESKVSIKFPLKKEASSRLNLDKYFSLASENVNIYDSQNQAFQSRCVKIRDNSTNYDTTINFRRKNYFANKTVNCGLECGFGGIDSNQYVDCNCNLEDKKEYSNSFEDFIFKSMPSFNYDIFFCGLEVFILPALYDNLGFRFAISTVALTILLILFVNLKKSKNMNENLENILHIDCEYYDPKKMTAEEYFEQKLNNSKNNSESPAPILVKENKSNINIEDSPDNILHERQMSENTNLAIERQKENIENDISVINIQNYEFKSNSKNNIDETNAEKQDYNSFSSRNKFMRVENLENKDNRLILKENNFLNRNFDKNLESSPKNINESDGIDEIKSQNDFKSFSSRNTNNFLLKTNNLVNYNLDKNSNNSSKIMDESNRIEEIKSQSQNDEIDKNVSNLNLKVHNDHKVTASDYKFLKSSELVKYDNRNFRQYYKDYLVHHHPLINLFLNRSLKEPIQIRIVLFITFFNLNFACNAFLFTDDYIDMRANADPLERESILYTIIQESFKTLLCLVVSTTLKSILKLILRLPASEKESLNQAMIKKDKELIISAYEIYMQRLKNRRIFIYVITFLLNILFLYYIIVFCGVYMSSSSAWMEGGVQCLILEMIIFGLSLPIILFITLLFVKKFPKLIFLMIVIRLLVWAITTFIV